MKNFIKGWLGISSISNTVLELKEHVSQENLKLRKQVYPKDELDQYNHIGLGWGMYIYNTPPTLIEKHQQLREAFEELDHKFDLLERFLQIQLVKQKTETQVYDWADEKETERFEPIKTTYEAMKADKNTLNK